VEIQKKKKKKKKKEEKKHILNEKIRLNIEVAHFD
jgi:hypothetical protein